MKNIFVRNSDNKITTIFQGYSEEDAKLSCPSSHRIEPYQEVKEGMLQYAFFVNGSVEYSKTIEEVQIDEAWQFLRAERNRRLTDSDWTQASDVTVDKQLWANYRQALRDLPANTVDPRDVVWPVKP